MDKRFKLNDLCFLDMESVLFFNKARCEAITDSGKFVATDWVKKALVDLRAPSDQTKLRIIWPARRETSMMKECVLN